MSRNKYPRKNIDRRNGLTMNRSTQALAEIYDATGMSYRCALIFIIDKNQFFHFSY